MKQVSGPVHREGPGGAAGSSFLSGGSSSSHSPQAVAEPREMPHPPSPGPDGAVPQAALTPNWGSEALRGQRTGLRLRFRPPEFNPGPPSPPPRPCCSTSEAGFAHLMWRTGTAYTASGVPGVSEVTCVKNPGRHAVGVKSTVLFPRLATGNPGDDRAKTQEAIRVNAACPSAHGQYQVLQEVTETTRGGGADRELAGLGRDNLSGLWGRTGPPPPETGVAGPSGLPQESVSP